MFKSVKYRFALFLALLVAAVATTAWLLATGHPFLSLLAVCVVLVAVSGLLRSYERLNHNFVFLLNALENGDYSFNFSEAGMTRRERELNSVLNAIKEILARARTEEIENEKFLSLIVAAIPVGIVIIDERDFVRVANDAALRLLGLHVFTHMKQLGMVDEAVLETFRGLTPGRKATIRIADERDERLISLGTSRIVIKRGTLRVITMHNIAGELEEREMESWIKLIRVMTHEIMNSIAPITSLSETMLLAWKESEQNSVGAVGVAGATATETATETATKIETDKLRRNTVDAFGTITSTARGLLSFVESYRRFTGIPKPDLHPVELAPFIENIVRLEAPLFDERGIKVTVGPIDPAITVAADPGQIGQVLVNLLKNAAEAIPSGRTDGKVEVSVSQHDDGTIHLDVANNGTPIPTEVLPHIFVPFFTTKSTGTGIGLSVSRYIMRLHGGNLKHHAEEGLTIFTMVFPAS